MFLNVQWALWDSWESLSYANDHKNLSDIQLWDFSEELFAGLRALVATWDWKAGAQQSLCGANRGFGTTPCYENVLDGCDCMKSASAELLWHWRDKVVVRIDAHLSKQAYFLPWRRPMSASMSCTKKKGFVGLGISVRVGTWRRNIDAGWQVLH